MPENKDKDAEVAIVEVDVGNFEVPLFIRDMKSLVNLDGIPDTEVGERCYSLLGGRVIFGIQLAEMIDSFLVALPSTLHSEDGGTTIDGKLLTASPVIRLMKNGVAFVTIPELEHQYHYFKFIKSLMGLLPGYFNETRTSNINESIETWEGKSPSRKRGSKELKAGPDPTEDEVDDPLVSMKVPYSRTTRH